METKETETRALGKGRMMMMSPRAVFSCTLLWNAIAMVRGLYDAEKDGKEDTLDLQYQSKWAEEEKNWTGDDYLYHNLWPIVDYATDGWPDWLYKEYDRPRVVEVRRFPFFVCDWDPFLSLAMLLFGNATQFFLTLVLFLSI